MFFCKPLHYLKIFYIFAAAINKYNSKTKKAVIMKIRIKMKNKHLLSISIALILTGIMTSCASIVSGGDPNITLNSNYRGTVTITTEKHSYSGVTFPAVVQVNRHKLDGQRIRISADDCEFDDVVLEKTVNPWAFGNVLIGGLIGWAVDLSTNCVSKPAQTQYTVFPFLPTKTGSSNK
jgi:hypothetical protein